MHNYLLNFNYYDVTGLDIHPLCRLSTPRTYTQLFTRFSSPVRSLPSHTENDFAEDTSVLAPKLLHSRHVVSMILYAIRSFVCVSCV